MTRIRYSLAALGKHWRAVLLGWAAFLVATCLWRPEWPLPRQVFRYMLVFDITQSMNTRDYHQTGWPEDRLNFAKESVRAALHELPCGSEIGLGLFTTQTVHFLFEPLELCSHYPIIEDVLDHIDWRMAWSADTHVEMGLYHAIRDLKKQDPDIRLAFLTDGQETPPQSVKPQTEGVMGEISGVIVGVGGITPVTVPRYDRSNQLLGVWENADIEKPPVSTTVYSERVITRTLPSEGPYLSWLDEPHLKTLSAITGLGYERLTSPAGLAKTLTSSAYAELRPTITDLRPFLGGLALVILTVVFGVEKGPRVRAK